MTLAQVLVVEDDADIREQLADLVRSEGYTVQTASDGREALALLQRSGREPCCILLDLMMPVMTGWELLGVLNQDDRLVTIPVVVVSAESGQGDLKAARIVKKPIAVRQLLEAIKEFCGPGRNCPSETLADLSDRGQ